RAKTARRNAILGIVVLLLIGGGAGGGLWYANQQGLLTAFVDDLNGKKTDQPTADEEELKKQEELKKKEEEEKKKEEERILAEAEAATKAKGYVWGLADGMWESPTQGDPLDLKYLAPGLKAVVALRPADIAKHPEGGRLLDPKVTGVLGSWVQQQLPATSGTT